MEIAMGAIGPLLPKLGDLLVGEYTLEKRVRKGIESLVRELTFIDAALRKVAKVPADQLDDGVKIWAENVKELSYQMEDIVDAFMVRVENGGEPTNPKNRVKKLVKKTTRLFKKGRDLHGISDAIEEAVGQAKELSELRHRYERDTRDASVGESIDPRIMALYKDVTELVGIDDKRDELINMLIEGDDWSERPLKTVSIVGFGGLGKTTLAKVGYDKMKVQFDCGAFVSVSRNPDMKKVLKNILYELDKKIYKHIHNASRDERHLLDELNEFLKDKRYLIIIDDIWDEEAWLLIKCAFPKNSFGSRLITTTRNVSVSEACCSSSDDIIYKMKPLSDDISRRLFYKRVFPLETGCPQEFEQVSQNILKKCGGVPLAIIAIASLLASNRQRKTQEQWYGVLNSIGRGLTEDEDASVKAMKKILLFSYYDLPSYLKPCLLYLSIYPEDHKIKRSQLICKWIAEGFVHSEKQETSLYELGDSYFNELINRSMIQPLGIDDEEKVEACRVHDMVLDLICSLSREENFVTILDGTQRKVFNSQSKLRRLSIQNRKVDVATTSMAHVRSLAFFGDDVLHLEEFTQPFHFHELISCSQVLRILDLGDGNIQDIQDPGYLGSLLHLRYLGLKGTKFTQLPMEIGKLQFLQTLDLSEAEMIRELPSSIVRLTRLMCLYVHWEMQLPSGMDNLKSLEVLSGVEMGSRFTNVVNLDIVKELGHLTKLRVLYFGCSNLDESLDKALVESLSNLQKLQVIIIGANVRVDLMVPPPQLRKLNCVLRTLPVWIRPSSLPLLSFLSIHVNERRPEDIRLLGMLPALRSLELSYHQNTSFSIVSEIEMLVVTADAFPCATGISFNCTPTLPSIFPPGAAPRLKSLVFCFPAMWIARGDFDLGMGHLPSLEKVVVGILCEEGSDAEVEKAEDALWAAAEDHPNRPTLHIKRLHY